MGSGRQEMPVMQIKFTNVCLGKIRDELKIKLKRVVNLVLFSSLKCVSLNEIIF